MVGKYVGIIVVVSVILLNDLVSSVKPKIVGGVEIPIEEVPYVVSLEQFGDQMCTCSILTEEYALCAAQCIFGINEKYRIRSGTNRKNSGGSLHYFVWSYNHPDFAIGWWEYDVSVVKVDPPFVFDATTQPIKIGTKPPEIGSVGLVAGWGATASLEDNPPFLIGVNLTIVPEGDGCDNIVEGLEFCAGDFYHSTCSGDWGGPFVQDGYLVGTASVYNYCTQPSTFINLTAPVIIDFILETTGIILEEN